MLNPCKELHALKPVERLVRLATKRKRRQHIVHSLFAPQSIPFCKNVIHQTRTVNFADSMQMGLTVRDSIDAVMISKVLTEMVLAMMVIIVMVLTAMATI